MSKDVPAYDLPIPDRPEGITQNALTLNNGAFSPRFKVIMDGVVKHLHQFVRETNITTEEWMTCIEFLTRTGQTCTPLRQETILLSDVLGVSALVDMISHPKIGATTDHTVLGPFFTEDAPDLHFGDSIASEGSGEYLYVQGTVKDTKGKPINGVTIETWETDGHGSYDTQKPDRQEPDCRGRLTTREDGSYGYRAVVPVSYPIPSDGPVGQLLSALGRHVWRPAHLHMMLYAPGYDKLTTALYPEGDDYISSDAVFGVKRSLVCKLTKVTSAEQARAKGFPKGDTFTLLEWDFVLATKEEVVIARQAQEDAAMAALQAKSQA